MESEDVLELRFCGLSSFRMWGLKGESKVTWKA